MIPGRQYLHALAACAGIAICATAAAASFKVDRDVQLLANFPALQKIAEGDDGAVRAFAKRISAAYASAGYNDFGPEFRRSGDEIIAQFARDSDDDTLKDARMALRRLQSALAKDAFVALPANAGDTLPDYHGLAVTFLENAKVAFKNVSLGKNPSNSLRNNKPALWLINNGNDVFSFVNSNGASSSFQINGDTAAFGTVGGGLASLTKTAAGTLTLSGANAYTGTTMINSGTLTIGSALLNATGTIALAGGTITGTIATGIAGTHWVAFLPGAEIPGDLSGTFKLYLSLAYTINGVDLPPQTTLYRVSDDYIAPDDAIVFPEPGLTIKLNVTISGGTPTPTPTPAE